MKKNKFPPGWDEERVRRVLAHYETQTEEEAVAEDEAAFAAQSTTVMDVPRDLLPIVRELIARHASKRWKSDTSKRRRTSQAKSKRLVTQE
jgi:hypothetical protein